MPIETSKYRFVVLAVYSIGNAINAMTWITFAPITSSTGVYYNVSAELVNLLSVVFLAFYLPLTLVSMYVFAATSVKTGLLIGTIGTTIGTWIRYASTSDASYGVLLLGQCFAAAAQPFFTNIPAKIAARWFPTDQRAAATVVGALFNAIGVAVGTIIPSAFINVGETGVVTGFDQLMLCEAILATGIFLLTIVLFKDKPKNPPSSSQEGFLTLEGELKTEFSITKILVEVKQCLTDREFLILFITFGVGLGLFNSITTVIEQLTSPFGATSDDASLFGGLMIVIGLIGAGFVGVYLDRTHRYVSALRYGYIGGYLVIILLMVVLPTGSIGATSFLFALLGFIVLPMLPTTLDAGAEATYPISEDVSSGLLMTSGQILGIIFIYVLDALLPPITAIPSPVPTTYVFPNSNLFIVLVFFVPAVVIYLYKGKYLRLNADGRNNGLVGDA